MSLTYNESIKNTLLDIPTQNFVIDILIIDSLQPQDIHICWFSPICNVKSIIVFYATFYIELLFDYLFFITLTFFLKNKYIISTSWFKVFIIGHYLLLEWLYKFIVNVLSVWISLLFFYVAENLQFFFFFLFVLLKSFSFLFAVLWKQHELFIFSTLNISWWNILI